MKKIGLFIFSGLISLIHAESLPTGGETVDVVLSSAGEYTLDATSVTYKSLKSGAAGLTTLNLVGDPVPEITLVDASTPVLGTTIQNSTLWVKGGRFSFPNKGYVYVGSSDSSTPKTYKSLILTDGASLENCHYLIVAAKEGGNSLALTNASISANAFYISNGGCQNSNRVLAGPGSSISATKFTMENGATSNTREPALFSMTGPDATFTVTEDAQIGHVPNGRFSLANGATATVKTMTCGNIARNGSGVVACRGNSYNIEIADSTLTCSGTLTVGNEAVTGLTFTGTNATISANTLVIGATAGSNNHTMRFTDSKVDVVDLALGKLNTTGNTLILEGPQTVFSHNSTGKPDIFGAGIGNRLIVRDGAKLEFANTRYAFQTATGSSLEIENGGSVIVNAKPFHLGYGTTARELDCAPNRLVIGSNSSFECQNFFLENVNSQFVVSNGTLTATGNCYIGCDSLVVPACNESTNCLLHVTGATPTLDLANLFVTGSCSHVRFTLSANGYAWMDSTRTAPIIATRNVSFAPNAEIEIDASALSDDLRNQPIKLIAAKNAFSIPDEVLARANARGAESRPRYTLSCASKVLSVTVKADPGTLLLFR